MNTVYSTWRRMHLDKTSLTLRLVIVTVSLCKEARRKRHSWRITKFWSHSSSHRIESVQALLFEPLTEKSTHTLKDLRSQSRRCCILDRHHNSKLWRLTKKPLLGVVFALSTLASNKCSHPRMAENGTLLSVRRLRVMLLFWVLLESKTCFKTM